jgi:signal transduction histidine kinase
MAMRLSHFITQHVDDILAEWDLFAGTQGPAADAMSKRALRDHAKEILHAIALDIESGQDSEQQQQKSQGEAPQGPGRESAASIHGALRQASDFSLLQLSAEFRALRATVLRLWLPTVTHMSAGTTQEMVRFNEAIDQCLAESILTFTDRADHARELFLAILGHDLRAPLAGMVLAGEFLEDPALQPDRVAEVGGRVRRSAELMNSMVRDLLGYCQTQLGSGIPIARTTADLGEVCSAAASDANATHPGSRFVVNAHGDLSGSFDPVRMHQLFTNLSVNAAQYGTLDQPIIIDASGSPDGITIEVTNQGPVIPEESLKEIFKPLVQLTATDESDFRPRTSLGLGLYVAREIAVAHGGSLEVRSNQKDGTTFAVRLPRTAENVQAR